MRFWSETHRRDDGADAGGFRWTWQRIVAVCLPVGLLAGFALGLAAARLLR